MNGEIIYDTIIIGSGPAGLSAAVYGMRAGLRLLVVERNSVSGGQVLNTWEVDNYLGLPGINGFDMGMKFREHVDKLGTEFVDGEVTAIERIDDAEGRDAQAARFAVCMADKTRRMTKTVILATGAVHVKLGVPGEDTFGGRGVSYCATCDGNFFRGQEAVVVGGGDVAVEDAIYLSRICSRVTLIHRRDALRATRVLQDELFALSNVEVRWNTVVREIRGDKRVSEVLLEDVKTGGQTELPVNAVFIAVGIRPETQLAAGLADMDEGGSLIAGENCETTLSGLYAAGDVRKKRLRQIVTAVADGANAATAVSDLLTQK